MDFATVFKEYQSLKYICIFIQYLNFSDAKKQPYLVQHTK